MKQEFDTTIVNPDPTMDTACVVMPFDAQAVFGSRRVKVKVMFDKVEYRGLIVNMGGQYLIGVNKEVRAALSKKVGDSVHVVVEADTQPRIVDVPDDLAQALSAAGLTDTFEALAPSHRKEYVRSIMDAKKPETRTARITKTVEMVRGKAKSK